VETYGERVQALLRALTLEEKVALLAGASMWYTTPVERLVLNQAAFFDFWAWG
jgi:hypothetical protein